MKTQYILLLAAIGVFSGSAVLNNAVGLALSIGIFIYAIAIARIRASEERRIRDLYLNQFE